MLITLPFDATLRPELRCEPRALVFRAVEALPAVEVFRPRAVMVCLREDFAATLRRPVALVVEFLLFAAVRVPLFAVAFAREVRDCPDLRPVVLPEARVPEVRVPDEALARLPRLLRLESAVLLELAVRERELVDPLRRPLSPDSMACAVSRLTSLLKLLFCPRAVVSW